MKVLSRRINIIGASAFAMAMVGMSGVAGASSWSGYQPHHHWNKYQYKVRNTTTVTNTNLVTVANKTTQTAVTGDATVMFNLFGGTAKTGDATNTSTTTTNISIHN